MPVVEEIGCVVVFIIILMNNLYYFKQNRKKNFDIWCILELNDIINKIIFLRF